MKVKFKKIHKDAIHPKQATELAGGWDVTATEIIHESDDFVICKLGFSLGLPAGYKLTLVPRSSLTKTKWVVQNSPGLGDEDFFNEYQIRFRCIPTIVTEKIFGTIQGAYYEEFPYKVGDRIGQVYLEEVIPIEFEDVDDLGFTARLGGYGSTNQ